LGRADPKVQAETGRLLMIEHRHVAWFSTLRTGYRWLVYGELVCPDTPEADQSQCLPLQQAYLGTEGACMALMFGDLAMAITQEPHPSGA